MALVCEFDPEGPPASLPCAFCEREAAGRRLEGFMVAGAHGWHCACGARAVALVLADLDETFDEVLALFGVHPPAAAREPLPQPVGRSGFLSVARYDGPATLAALLTQARAQGIEVVRSELCVRYLLPAPHPPMEMSHALLWARVGNDP